MRQRVMIGLGLVLNANLIIADEATTSLDVIVEAKLVDQLREIRDEFGVIASWSSPTTSPWWPSWPTGSR